jgi:CRP-like cAMP-binding protein
VLEPNHIINHIAARTPSGPGPKRASFNCGEVLARQGDTIEFVYLPESGMLSYTVDLEEAEGLETGSIGRNGAIGAAAAFGSKFHLTDVVTTLHTTGWAVPAGRIAAMAEEVPEFRSRLFKIEQYTAAQARQIAACNACHTISQRFAGWILRAFDESGASELIITQEKIAQLLGVQRASISIVAHGLQNGVLQYRRGRISLIDRIGLERHACGCHAAIWALHHELFGAAEERRVLAPVSVSAPAPAQL